MIHARTTVYLNTAHESFFGFDHTAQLRLAATFDLAMTDITGAAITTSGALEHIFNQLNIPRPHRVLGAEIPALRPPQPQRRRRRRPR
jgi:hypothetical protein